MSEFHETPVATVMHTGVDRPIDPAERVRLAAIKVSFAEAPGEPPMGLRLKCRTLVSFAGTKLEGKLA